MPCLHDTIRCFNRFELKYLLTLQEAEKFKAGLRPCMLPDEHGNNNGRYSLTSLYYDSPDFRCYREKVDGLRFRRKLRIRSYDSDEMLTEEAPVVVEIKQRVDRVTQKRRTVMSYGDAPRPLPTRHWPKENIEFLERYRDWMLSGGTYTAGTQAASMTLSGITTTAGVAGGGPGGMPGGGGPGGGGGGHRP